MARGGFRPIDILVTGGTGALGRPLVKALRAAGHRAVVMSRSTGEGADWRRADLASGEGLAAAVRGMDAVIHAGSATTQVTRGRAIDVEGTRRLAERAREAGVKHLVLISIVGMEGINYPYYASKRGAEAVVGEGMVPWSILRATQFHTLIEVFLAAFSRLPGLMTVPFAWRFQPVDTGDVAGRLVEVVEAAPAGILPDFGGPEARDLGSLAESWRRARKLRKRMLNLPLPFQFSRQVASGRLLSPDHRDGSVTWEQYLERRYPA